MLSVYLDLKITFNLQYSKFPLSLVLQLSEVLPKYGKTPINSFLGMMNLRSFWINSLFKNFLIQMIHKIMGITIA